MKDFWRAESKPRSRGRTPEVGRGTPFPRVEGFLKLIVELLAAIPSVVYGLWGIFVVIPLVRPIADWLYGILGGFRSLGLR